MGAAKGRVDGMASRPAPMERRRGTPRRDVAALVRALADSGLVRLLVNGAEAEASARKRLGSAADIHQAKYGDIWLRDTGPIVARAGGKPAALRFKTNAWGGKFDLPDDATVGGEIARLAGHTGAAVHDFVLEGGAIEHDGAGTVLTTAQTLLNANRNSWKRRTQRRRWPKRSARNR